MRLKDIINNLNKSSSNECRNVQWNLEAIAYECDLSCYDLQQDNNNVRLRSYWVADRMCTDTRVGYRAYFLDDVFVCLSCQTVHKSDKTFKWVSKAALEDVRIFLISLQEKDELSSPTEYLDLEEDFGEGYKVEYAEQLIRKEVIYKGKPATVIKDSSQGYTNLHTITIKREKQYPFEIEVDVRDVTVPWYIV